MKYRFSAAQTDAFMGEALAEAEKALRENEVPVGCVAVDAKGNIIARAHNTTVRTLTVSSHAEINAINGAAKVLETLNLSGCSLFVTLEPCPMCAGAIAESNVSAVYCGAGSKCLPPKFSGNGKAFDPADLLPEKTDVFRGIREEECASLLTDFFSGRR